MMSPAYHGQPVPLQMRSVIVLTGYLGTPTNVAGCIMDGLYFTDKRRDGSHWLSMGWPTWPGVLWMTCTYNS